jgi:hypothetical protein
MLTSLKPKLMAIRHREAQNNPSPGRVENEVKFMSIMRTLVAFTAVAALGGAALAPAASAQANCETYGKLALQQQKENETAKCGFTGPEWSPDLKAHIDWCTKVGPDKWKEQLTMRTQALNACKAKK